MGDFNALSLSLYGPVVVRTEVKYVFYSMKSDLLKLLTLQTLMTKMRLRVNTLSKETKGNGRGNNNLLQKNTYI